MSKHAVTKQSKVLYPTPEERDPMNSLNVWAETSHWIIQNDMVQADDAKKRRENAQRQKAAERVAQGQPWIAKYFVETDDGWVVKPKLVTQSMQADTSKKTGSGKPKRRQSTTPQLSGKTEVDQPLSDEKDDRKKSSPDTDRSAAAQQLPPEKRTQQPPTHEIDRDDSSDAELDENTNGMPIPGTSPSTARLLSPSRTSQQLPAHPQSPVQRAMLAQLPSRRVKRNNSVDDMKRRINPFRVDEPALMSGWMKMRNSMKIWVNKWFVLRPGMLIYYKDKVYFGVSFMDE
jgi:hypothetical protein